MKKPKPSIVGMVAGIGVILVSMAMEYFYRPHIVGANIGAGVLFMAGVVVFGIFGCMYLLEDYRHRDK